MVLCDGDKGDGAHLNPWININGQFKYQYKGIPRKICIVEAKEDDKRQGTKYGPGSFGPSRHQIYIWHASIGCFRQRLDGATLALR